MEPTCSQKGSRQLGASNVGSDLLQSLVCAAVCWASAPPPSAGAVVLIRNGNANKADPVGLQEVAHSHHCGPFIKDYPPPCG